MTGIRQSLLVLVLSLGCVVEDSPIVNGWPPHLRAEADSIARHLAQRLGEAPDTLEWCAPSRIRMVYINAKADLPLRLLDGAVHSHSVLEERPVIDSIARHAWAAIGHLEVDTLTLGLFRVRPIPWWGGVGGTRGERHIARGDLPPHEQIATIEAGWRPCDWRWPSPS